MLSGNDGDPESSRRKAHRDYETAFHEMRAEWTPEQLARAERFGYDKPLPYEPRRSRRATDDDEEEFADPADRAVVDRTPIVDFDEASQSELQTFSDQFRGALEWATHSKNGSQPDLMQMGARMLTIFGVMKPELKTGMDLRIPKKMEMDLLSRLPDPLGTGKFFRRPLAWVRKCTSLVQLGKRGYSMIYVLAGDLINSATCSAIGGMDNKSRQAANKPIQDFRDTFGGIKSLPMRGTKTRQRCKRSQEQR
jgi:hypothetical protein